ncbi:MAG TPA: ATP-binding protein [Devosiaceae bacterium]|nr:ATP-binding protein [Devosiaceae bacterium]
MSESRAAKTVRTPMARLNQAMRLLADISPVSLAIAGTAAAAAALFVVYDAIQSFDEQRVLDLLPGADHLGLERGVFEHGLVAFAIAALAAALTFRRRAEATAAHARKAVEDVVTTIPFGIALWTPEGQLVVCNESYRRSLKGGSPIARGESYDEAVKQLTLGGHLKVVAEGQTGRLIELHRQDNSCLLIDERPLGSGGFVTLVTDITERKRADLLLTSIQEEQRQFARRYHEEKLKAEAASRAKTSFLAHLSHDIRTPLNHIIGFADLIRHQTYGPLGDARYLGYIDSIRASGEKLLNSFATILDLAELESGSKPLNEEVLAVDALLVTVMRRFSGQAGRAGVVFGLGAPSGAEIRADRFGLERMLGNLVENAIRFTPSGGKVVLAAYAAEDGVVVEVSDTGIGMSEEQVGRLSQPFAFGDAAFTREHQGAGLGVAIARAIAELSGGRLAIDSSPALGTTVAVSLPFRARREQGIAAE